MFRSVETLPLQLSIVSWRMSKVIAICFSYSNAPLSRFIRWITKSKYSHTYVRYYHPLFECDLILEAELHGITEKVYEKVPDSVELLPPEGVDLTPGLEILGETLGRAYDFGSLVGRLWVYAWRWLGRKVRNPLRNPRRDVCVENVLRMVAMVEPRFGGFDPEVETPQSLYQRLVDLGWKPVV